VGPAGSQGGAERGVGSSLKERRNEKGKRKNLEYIPLGRASVWYEKEGALGRAGKL